MTFKQLLMALLFMMIAFSNVVGAENTTENNKTEFKSYVGLNSEYTEILAKPAGIISIQYGLSVGENWNLGIVGSGIYYDHSLNDAVETGAYRLEGGYGGIFIEYQTDISNNLMLSFKYTTGTGLIKYELEKEYRKDKLWYERIVDQDNFVINIIAAELSYKLSSRWWIGCTISGKLTSPIELRHTDDFLLNNISGGLTLKYQIN